MTQPPTDRESAGRDDFFAPRPRPRPRHAAPEPATQQPVPQAAYPGLPLPGADPDSGPLTGDPFVPPYTPPGAYPAGSAGYGPPYPPESPYSSYLPPFASQPPPPPARRWPWIAALVVALAAAGTAVYFVLRSDSSSPHRIALPESIGAYSMLHGTAADNAATTMRALAGNNPQARDTFNKASIGAYGNGTGDAPGMIVVVLPASVAGSDEIATGFRTAVENIGTGAKPYATGAHGGEMLCGKIQIGRITESVCTWDDVKTIGILEAVRPPLSLDATAALTSELRDAVDR